MARMRPDPASIDRLAAELAAAERRGGRGGSLERPAEVLKEQGPAVLGLILVLPTERHAPPPDAS